MAVNAANIHRTVKVSLANPLSASSNPRNLWLTLLFDGLFVA